MENNFVDMNYSILLDAVEGNVVFHLIANDVSKFDKYTLIVDGIELRTKDPIVDVFCDFSDDDLMKDSD